MASAKEELSKIMDMINDDSIPDDKFKETFKGALSDYMKNIGADDNDSKDEAKKIESDLKETKVSGKSPMYQYFKKMRDKERYERGMPSDYTPPAYEYDEDKSPMWNYFNNMREEERKGRS